ncbi:MAG TPA: hypothetical protein VF143_09175 [Candidatus Nanopelagicales bacterium]
MPFAPARALSVLSAAAAMVLVAASPAPAAPPTRVVDTTAQIVCEATAGDAEVVVGVSRSDLAGTDARAEVTVNGEYIGEGSTTSDWTSTTFRSTIPLTDRNGDPAGEVSFAGSYRPASEPVTNESKFQVGNVHVVERHTETVLGLSDLTLLYDGEALVPDRCDGWLTEGYLSYTNPSMRVERGSALPYDCTSTNPAGLPSVFAEGGLGELFVDVPLSTDPEISASAVIDAVRGPWAGSMRVFENSEEAGAVAATATLVKQRPFHRLGAEGEHFRITPYDFTLQIEGGSGWEPVTVQCVLYDTQIKLRYPNPEA